MLQEQATLPNGAIIQDRHGEYYLVEALLGQGGFSAVYRIRDRRTKQKIYALKEIINPQPQDRRNLTFEAELLMRLGHRRLPRVYQVFEHVKLNRLFMLMDYVEGKNLEMLRKEQPDERFSLIQALALMAPIIEAVDYLHKQKQPVVHRDIKPANIIVPNDVTDASLVDFGLAKEYVENKTTGVFRYGTPGYAAPEQYGQGTNLRTDIYALSATFYTLLTGAIPTDALTRTLSESDLDPLERADKLCPAIPSAVGRVIEHGMSLRKEQRFSSVEEFWRELGIAAAQQNITDDQPTTVIIPSTPAPSTRTSRKGAPRRPFSRRQKRILMIVLLLMLVFALIDAIFLYTLRSHQSPHVSRPHQISKVTATPTSSPLKLTVDSFCRTVNTPIAPLPSKYPQLNSCYGGTTSNKSAAAISDHGPPMFLWDITQNQDTITGLFRGLGQPEASFSGKVSLDQTLFFDVNLTNPLERIHFQGYFKTDEEMPLTYKTFNQNNEAIQDAYGVCNMSPYTA